MVVVGVGAFARNHARVYHKLERDGFPVHLVGVVDPDTARADAVAQEFGCRSFGSVEQLLSTYAEIQAASVAAPTLCHLKIAKQLIEAGVDVLIEKPIAASSSFAITSQLSVLISPEPGSALTHQPARLQAGELVSYVWPRYPRPGDRYKPAETIKVRATIGRLGQVLNIRRLSGSTSLLPAAISAIRQWRYKPTLLNEKPVQAQQDVTIEFRLPQR